MKKLIPIWLLLFSISCNNSNETKTPGGGNISSSKGEVLPFSEPPSASTYGESIFESQHKRRQAVKHLPADAPNILIVLMDDVGFGTPSTFGGEFDMIH